MPGIQSNNITSLCSKLGFGPEFPAPERDHKAFLSQVTNFREVFSAKGNELKHFTAISESALHFADTFCKENNRGATFWGLTTHGAWPNWPKDQAKIVNSLAHIFSLQAYYKYQRQTKQAKQKSFISTESSPDIMEDSDGSSSPSSIFVEYPVNDSRQSSLSKRDVDASLDRQKPALIRVSSGPQDGSTQSCILEIMALSHHPDATCLKQLNIQWLDKPGARWPPSLDTHVKLYMHEYDFYVADEIEVKLPPTTGLTKGTELEECSAKQQKTLEVRLKSRILQLTRDLMGKKLVEHAQNGGIHKTSLFKSFFTESWASVSGQTFKRHLPKKLDKNISHLSVSPQRGLRTVPPTRRRRTASDAVLEIDEGHFQKRQRDSSSVDTSSKCAALPSEEPAGSRKSAIDNGLTNGTDNTQPQNPHSPVPNSGLNESTRHAVQHTHADVHLQQTAAEALSTVISEKCDPPNSSATTQQGIGPQANLKIAALSESAKKQTLVLIIQKADLSLDYHNPLPSSSLALSVQEFFKMFAEKSGEPAEALTYLTFTFLFAEPNASTVMTGDEEGWERLKDETRFLAQVAKIRKPHIKHLHILVEIRDLKSLASGDAGQDNSLGF